MAAKDGVVAAGALEVAISTIRQEHRCLERVVAVLRQWVAKVAVGHAAPDFEFFATALYYINDFPERQHHPKEDEYLFSAIRRRTRLLDAVLDVLRDEHVRGASMIAAMEHALVHYQGGAPDGFVLFKEAVDAYASMLRDHMHKEEEVLNMASRHLHESDWQEIATAFESNDDPLFGPNARTEFGKLYVRIINSLPGKLRPLFQRPARAGADVDFPPEDHVHDQ